MRQWEWGGASRVEPQGAAVALSRLQRNGGEHRAAGRQAGGQGVSGQREASRVPRQSCVLCLSQQRSLGRCLESTSPQRCAVMVLCRPRQALSRLSEGSSSAVPAEAGAAAGSPAQYVTLPELPAVVVFKDGASFVSDGAKKETFFTCFSCASSSVCLLRCFCLFLWQRSVCFFGWRADHPYYRRLECLQPAVFAARQTPGEDRGHAAVAPIVTPCDLSSCPGCLPVLGAGSEYVVRSAWGVPSFAVLTVGTPRAMEWAQAGDGLLQRSKRVIYEAKAAVMKAGVSHLPPIPS
ncbi:uncharacterized protein LOC135177221 isoform X4 [Pogoniulus pusillus]|uniref:uncharacterized protein LOC135177221 isoform X4 n=2 Tax=Pogoniulus pusillus TaxID=488313 RepID=UPI0030B950B4